MAGSQNKELERIKKTVETDTPEQIVARMLGGGKSVDMQPLAELVAFRHLTGVVLPENSISVDGINILVMDGNCQKKIDDVCSLLSQKDILQNSSMYGLFEKYKEVEIFWADQKEFISRKRAIFKDKKSANRFWEAYKKVYAILFRGMKITVKVSIKTTEVSRVYQI